MTDNDRGSFASHVPCRCVDCADRHGDQVSPDDVEIDALKAEVARLSAAGMKEFTKHQETIGTCDALRKEIAVLLAERDGAIAEAAAAKRERLAISISWIPPDVARKAAEGAAEAMREACARVGDQIADHWRDTGNGSDTRHIYAEHGVREFVKAIRARGDTSKTDRSRYEMDGGDLIHLHTGGLAAWLKRGGR